MRKSFITVVILLAASPAFAQLSAIAGFRMWDAQPTPDVLVDNVFEEADNIQAGVADCTAIEVEVNAYLQQAGVSPGSVNIARNAINNCQNAYPYGLGRTSSATVWNCTTFSPGDYTLVVTPYDNDNCVGLAGTPVTLNFTAGAETTRTEYIQFTQAAPGPGQSAVVGWKFLYGSAHGIYNLETEDKAATPVLVGSTYTTSITAPETGTYYIIGQSYDNAGTPSDPSNEIVRTSKPQCP